MTRSGDVKSNHHILMIIRQAIENIDEYSSAADLDRRAVAIAVAFDAATLLIEIAADREHQPAADDHKQDTHTDHHQHAMKLGIFPFAIVLGIAHRLVGSLSAAPGPP